MSRTFWPSDGDSHLPRTDAGPRSDLVGRTLADGLRVLEKLGDTSYGSLYRARTADPGVDVDLIFLRPDGFETLWDHLSRARGINHPNIAGLKGMGRTSEGLRYVALEVLRGELLSDMLSARRVLPLDEAIDLMLQAASGLQAAHEAGLLHGSLSPGSILVSRAADGYPLVKLIRFGLAEDGRASATAGNESTGYTAPERIAGYPGDARSDIFSLGAVLHHMLSGEPPGDEPGEASPIPKAARSVISRALEPLPGHRFETAAAFGRALAAVRGEPAEQGRRAGAGRRGAVAIAAGLAVVTVAGFWLLQSAERSRPEAISGRRVTVSGAAPAGQVEDSMTSQSTPRDRAAARSPKSGAATPSLPDVSRPKRPVPRASAPEREVPSTTREPAPASAPIPNVAAPPRREVGPKAEVRSPAAAEPAETPSAPPDRPGSAVAPEHSDAGAGTTESGSAAGSSAAEAYGSPDSAVGYAPVMAAEAPRPAESLTSTTAMRLALSDVLRLQIAAGYEEVRPGRLVLALGSGFRTSTALDYNLRQLYAAYTDLLDHPDDDPVLELWQDEDKIGEYTRDGLHLGPE